MAIPHGGGHKKGGVTSCFHKMTQGFLLGFTAGGMFGAILGGLMSKSGSRAMSMARVGLQSGGAFGFFLGIGAGVRC